jgi:DNA invertase Pin-like site-specific DNA recombinase
MAGSRARLAAVPQRPLRVVLYVRVSALMGRGGRENFHSPDVQIGAMRRLTEKMREIAVVQDLDRGGRNFDREGIIRIRRMAERGEVDALAVYDVSRLGRNVRESLEFLADLADRGVVILSASEHVDTSDPAGRLMLTNMLAIAEYRSDEIGRSWSAAIARRAEKGVHHGNPIGYTRVDGKLRPDPILGPAVAKMWADYAAGLPISQICRELAAVRGGKMQASIVKKAFRRPVYLGHVVADGQVVVRDAHPALVDQATWEIVQLRLAADRTTPPRALQVTWALVGIAFCPCGARLQRNPRLRKGVLEQRLKCGKGPSRGIVGEHCPGIGFPMMDRIQDEVLRQVAEYVRQLRTDDVARSEQLLRRTNAMADGRALRRRLSHVQEAVAKLARSWALGDLTDDEFRPATAQLRSEAEALRARLGELGDVESRPTPEEAASAAEALVEMWPDMLVSERNLALRALVERVVVRRADRWREPEADRVMITWR